jgi:hypothetical protein
MGERISEKEDKKVCLLSLTFLNFCANSILGPTATEEGKTRLINVVMQVCPPPSPSPFHS